MFLRKVSSANIRFLIKRKFHKSSKVFSDKEFENPIIRTFRILGNDVLKTFKSKPTNVKGGLMEGIPSHTDVVIIGGGAIGSSIAYWLKEKTHEDAFSIVVIEKDFTYAKSSTCLSVGGLRQQFSLPENIQMSLYAADFLRSLKRRFGPEADVNFTPHGYLLLATEEGAGQLIDNSKLQKELGACNIILQKDELKDRFPWINVDDVAIGCLGLEKEGWFDPWSLLQLLKHGAIKKGTQYINGTVVDFMSENRTDLVIEGINESSFEQATAVVVQTPEGERKTINFAICIIAAGADSGQVAELLNIGTGRGILSVPLPVERRKRYVYSFACQDDPPGLNTPMTIDYTGAYFRRDGLGGDFIAGISPDVEDEPETTNLDVNYEFFDNKLWPILANRVPGFNGVKVKSGWSGFYEYNRYDENGIIGPHPYFTNLYIATGFSGHGIQQSPAVGRAVAELILDGKFQTIDLTRLGFDRLIMDKPMFEERIM